MQDTSPLDSLIQEIQTTEDAAEVLQGIGQFTTSIYKTDSKSIMDQIENIFSSNVASQLKSILKKNTRDITNPEEIKHVLEEIRIAITSLPTLSLIIASAPTRELSTLIYDWTQAELKKPLLLELIYDRSIVGGAIIIFEGKYLDLSLKHKLDTYFERKQQDIIVLLDKNSKVKS